MRTDSVFLFQNPVVSFFVSVTIYRISSRVYFIFLIIGIIRIEFCDCRPVKLDFIKRSDEIALYSNFPQVSFMFGKFYKRATCFGIIRDEVGRYCLLPNNVLIAIAFRLRNANQQIYPSYARYNGLYR